LKKKAIAKLSKRQVFQDPVFNESARRNQAADYKKKRVISLG
jgi:hypothetical protein